jgi:hypothetical protein
MNHDDHPLPPVVFRATARVKQADVSATVREREASTLNSDGDRAAASRFRASALPQSYFLAGPMAFLIVFIFSAA